MYSQEQVIESFKIYSVLAINGYLEKSQIPLYFNDNDIRGLVDQYAIEVSCNVIVAGDIAYLIPLTTLSPFHISNETIKKKYLATGSTNSDIYTMYFSIIILFGEFYNSYTTTNPTRDFITLEGWVDAVNERILALDALGEDQLKALQTEYDYNWLSIIEKWQSTDDIKANKNNKNKRVQSRYSFINTTCNFLMDQGLIEEVGNDEMILTEKAKTIIQRFFMEFTYNRDILEIIYEADNQGRS